MEPASTSSTSQNFDQIILLSSDVCMLQIGFPLFRCLTSIRCSHWFCRCSLVLLELSSGVLRAPVLLKLQPIPTSSLIFAFPISVPGISEAQRTLACSQILLLLNCSSGLDSINDYIIDTIPNNYKRLGIVSKLAIYTILDIVSILSIVSMIACRLSSAIYDSIIEQKIQ